MNGPGRSVRKEVQARTCTRPVTPIHPRSTSTPPGHDGALPMTDAAPASGRHAVRPGFDQDSSSLLSPCRLVVDRGAVERYTREGLACSGWQKLGRKGVYVLGDCGHTCCCVSRWSYIIVVVVVVWVGDLAGGPEILDPLGLSSSPLTG